MTPEKRKIYLSELSVELHVCPELANGRRISSEQLDALKETVEPPECPIDAGGEVIEEMRIGG